MLYQMLGSLVVRSYQIGLSNPFPDVGQHLANTGQIGEHITFALFVIYPLAVYENFHDALAARGNGYRCVGSKMPEKLICHPRGSTKVLSTDAVGNLNLDFAFH